MFKTIQQTISHAINDSGNQRTETVKLNTRTGKFFVRIEGNDWISDATVYKVVRKFDTLTAVLAYLDSCIGGNWVRA